MILVSKKYVALFSILLFLIIFYVIALVIKPGFLYNIDGSIKQFGLGYAQKTIIPFWLLTIGIAVVSYLIIYYYSMVNIVF